MSATTDHPVTAVEAGERLHSALVAIAEATPELGAAYCPDFGWFEAAEAKRYPFDCDIELGEVLGRLASARPDVVLALAAVLEAA